MDSSEYLLIGHNFPNFSSWIAPAVRTKFQNFFSGSGRHSAMFKSIRLVCAHNTLKTLSHIYSLIFYIWNTTNRNYRPNFRICLAISDVIHSAHYITTHCKFQTNEQVVIFLEETWISHCQWFSILWSSADKAIWTFMRLISSIYI